MNYCPQCNTPLREGAKFCTTCGTKIEVAPACPRCNTLLKPNAKFCTTCGEKLILPEKTSTNSEPESASMQPNVSTPAATVVAPENAETATAGGRIYWNILPGQVARIISESEFEQYKNLRGIIVPEGTTAFVRANGRTIASISGGSYDFTGNPEIVGLPPEGIFKRGWSFITNLFRSKKAKEEAEKAQEELSEYERQQKLILEHAKVGSAFSVVVILNKAFPLLVGSRQNKPEDYKNFVPMKIRTRYVELEVGLNAYFKITDAERFILHYLADCNLFSTTRILDEISDSVRVTIQDVLENYEPSDNEGIPEDYKRKLKDALNTASESDFFGISVVRIVEITTTNEDLTRFSELSKEMYLSEKELDYLRRTNDFKNRLAEVTNAQRLHEARSEFELQRELDAINRDNILREDELEKFKKLLENERIVREAQSNEERDAALAEIERTELIRKQDLELLKLQQTNALSMMQLRDKVEFERVRMQGDQELAVSAAKNELEIAVLRDEYTDSRREKDLAFQRKQDERLLDLEKRRREMDAEDDKAQFERFMAMQNAQLRDKDAARTHELEMERLKGENARHLSAEQLFAMRANAESATAYAQSLGTQAANARLDEERRRFDEERRRKDEMMMQMFQSAMANKNGQIESANARADRQERRTDDAYDRSLDYTSRITAASQSTRVSAPAGKFCAECGTKNSASAQSCTECGATL